MRDFGKTISLTVGSPSNFLMETDTKANLKEVSTKDTDLSFGRTVSFTRATGEPGK